MTQNIEYANKNTECVLDIATDVIQMLTQAGETLGVAGSLTGGGLMMALTSVPGSSAVFRGGVVSYATPLKQLLLNVDASLIAEKGVIHGEVAAQMADGTRKVSTLNENLTTWGIGAIGVAGPTPQDGKPIGMVFIGIASPSGSRGMGPFHFTGS
ncbi:putative competence/damage-inducible protein CinA [Nemania sp. FL0916]|nr:putative competence/damage-inducible protein CinA [Nemania sp. FL0916]